MNYHPKGMQMWDAWYTVKDDTVHTFHLQRLRPDSQRTDFEADSIGHAISKDLIHWEERPLALSPGEQGDPDDLCLFTGCTHGGNDGKYYTYYTMRSSAEDGRVQRLGVAVSTDSELDVWTKHEKNPIIVPDKRYYSCPENPSNYGTVDCRDLCVVTSPDNNGYYGFFAARQNAEEMPLGAVVACCYSKDLINWEQLPPAFVAGRFTIVEVPEVFYLSGKWYMLLLCNNEYGNRDIFPTEPRLTMGTIYATADNISGPYTISDDYILMASETYNGISCRTLMFNGERTVLYTSVDRSAPFDSAFPCMGVLSTPKILRVTENKLRMYYSPLIESEKKELICNASTAVHTGRLPYETPGVWTCSGSTIKGSVKTAWARYNFDKTGRSFIYDCNITVKSGVGAGLVCKASPNGYSGCVFMLDVEKQQVQFLRLPNLAVVDSRSFALEHNVKYNLKIVSKDKYMELYINDELILQNVHYAVREGHFGLISDRAETEFTNPQAFVLNCIYED